MDIMVLNQTQNTTTNFRSKKNMIKELYRYIDDDGGARHFIYLYNKAMCTRVRMFTERKVVCSVEMKCEKLFTQKI